MLTGSNNAEKIWNYLTCNGMTSYGAAGLMGNLKAESGMIAKRVEVLCLKRLKENGKTYTDEAYTAAVDSGQISRSEFLNPLPGKQYGYGLAQWTVARRKAGLYDLCKKRSVSIGDLETQLDWLMQELSTSYKKVYSVLQTASTIREASDAVLCDFERPANITESTKEKRASYGQEYYDKYAKEVGNMSVLIGHASISETVGINGAKGDSTKKEVCTRTWYSKPWDFMAIHPDANVREKHAATVEAACANDNIGYGQSDRNTLNTQANAVDYDLAKITTKCNCDCSSLQNVAAVASGAPRVTYESNGWTTRTMKAALKAAGYKIIDDATYLKSSAYCVRGAIYVKEGSHTVCGLTNGSKASQTLTKAGITASSSSASSGSTTGGSTYMFEVGTVKNGCKGNDVKLLQRLLKSNNCKGADGKDLTIDGDCGSNTVAAIKTYQKSNDLTVDGIAGANTWKSILLR